MLGCFFLFFQLVCYILIGGATASKPLSILLIEPVLSPSHHVWTMHLIKGLLRKGHHVHAVSIHKPMVEGKLAQNLTYDAFDEVMKSYEANEDYNPAEWETYSTFYMTYFIYEWGIESCKAIIKSKEAKKLLEMIKTVEFDVIVHDITVDQCFYGLWEVAKNKPPVVGYVPFGPAPWLKDYIGGPNYPTVRPYPATFTKPVSLWQRTCNTVYYISNDVLRYYYYLPTLQRLAEEFMGHPIRPLREIEKDRINMLLLNTHSAFESGIPLPPNALEIAGLNAQTVEPIAGEVVEKLPEDIRVFLDGAKDGAIVISLGTNVKWKTLGLDKINAVIMAVSKLKQRVVWKLDIEVPFEIPKNLMIVKWIPQNDVLSHKNMRAVWTHGGLLSTQEAVWKGLPMIVMPFFMDQKSNAQILVSKGVAIHLDVKILSLQSVSHAFQEIIYNESYTRNMKQLSSEYRDRPISPLELAIWSIEYSVRHPNGSLATPLRSQSWVEQNQIDVYAFLFLILIIILFSIFFVIKTLISFCCNRIFTRSNVSKRKLE
ncbi:UDP-glycosyltransferase UGT5-like [Solenopsis invicta]|uniref:UDP-glycosyltransferase UGT5-like n=1 Tax=Solenopsis invicta TaxID=13686 RepID=UPI00193D6C2C|nr:UDP-glycosyltransferase UGT5-like [Solenopsis invicta]